MTIRPKSSAPASAVVNRTRSVIVRPIEPAFTMLLDKQPDLFDGLTNFSRFSSAASIDPSTKSPSCSGGRLALLPGDYTYTCRKFSSRGNKP